MEYVYIKGSVFTDPFIIEWAIRVLNSKEELKEAYRGNHTAYIHFKRNVFGSYKLVFGNLQEEKDNAQSKIQVFIPTLFMEIHSREQISKSEIGKSEKPGVTGVAYRHIGVLNKIHISCEEEIYSVAYRNYYLIVMKLVKAYKRVMD